MTTRDRLLTEGMRLFGERGYTATSIAQIEAAAGLSPGSGSLYKHFRSKQALLTAGLDRLLSTEAPVAPAADAAISAGGDDLAGHLSALIRAGLERMDTDRDLSRLLFKGLEAFPDLLGRFGDEEISRLHRNIAAVLSGMAATDADLDWSAVAVALQGATAHYWLMVDTFGEHPTGIDEERFVRALTAVAMAALTNGSTTAVAGTTPDGSKPAIRNAGRAAARRRPTKETT